MPKSQKNGIQKQNEVSQWIFLAPGMINNETLLVSILPSTGIVAKIARPYFVILFVDPGQTLNSVGIDELIVFLLSRFSFYRG